MKINKSTDILMNILVLIEREQLWCVPVIATDISSMYDESEVKCLAVEG